MTDDGELMDPGAWVVGGYYRNTHEVRIYNAWGAELSPAPKVPSGSVFLCHKVISKFNPIKPDQRRRYARLVTYDPRFEKEDGRYLHYDVCIEYLNHRTGVFELIDSPLESLAIAGAGLAPLMGE